MNAKGLEGDISTNVEDIPEKSAMFRQMMLDKRYLKNFSLQDILDGFPHDRSILVRIEFPEDGTSVMLSIVEEL